MPYSVNGSISKIAEGRTLKAVGLTSKKRCRPARKSANRITARCLTICFLPDGGDIPTDRFIVPRDEVELAFVLAETLRHYHAVRRTTPRIM